MEIIRFILSQFREGKVVKLTPANNREQFEKIERQLEAFEPIALIAAEYYDAAASNLPDDAAALHERLLTTIRESGLV